MGNERDIRFLLNLYQKEYVKGEVRSKEFDKNIRDEATRKHRHLIFDELVNEINTSFNSDQVMMVRYLIDDFNEDFKQLHRKVEDETIILAFMFFLKKLEKPSVRLSDYAVCSKYRLTNDVFEIVLCRMMLKFMKRCPIVPYNRYGKDEHDILVRSGER